MHRFHGTSEKLAYPEIISAKRTPVNDRKCVRREEAVTARFINPSYARG
jgi:hypothetical protein